MCWVRTQKSYSCLLLVSVMAMLQVSPLRSLSILSQPRLSWTENQRRENNFNLVETMGSQGDLEASTEVRNDQQVAKWSRSEMAAEVVDWPCPISGQISPCTCSINDDYGIEIDCSKVKSDSDIAFAFSVLFPFDDVFTFTIADEETITPITAFPQNMFLTKWFTNVYVVGTTLEQIEDTVFDRSHDTLETLALQNNKLTEFPFEVVLQYSKLKYIHLNGNDIKELPKLSSPILQEVNMNNNPELVLTSTEVAETFVGAPELRKVRLSHTSVNPVPPNLFSQLTNINEIYLSGNNLEFLVPETINAPGNTITLLDLSSNTLSVVQIGSISGLALDAMVDLSMNNIDELTEEMWKPIFDQLETGSIILDGNPLICGCDVYWIIQDDDQLAKISQDTTCASGINVHDLPVEAFQHC